MRSWSVLLTRALLTGALLLPLHTLLPVHAARADEAETEQRLKRIGVEKHLRDEVRVAIDRGVKFLAAQQRVGGDWVGPKGVIQARIAHGDGLNALCALALMHADTAASRAAARRAVEYLLPAKGSMRPQLLQTIYGAGIAIQLLDVLGGDGDADRRRIGAIAARIAHGRNTKSGSWNYRTGATPAPGIQVPPRAPKMAGPLNLSTAQFAVLGLHAAARRGARSSKGVWTDVLNGLLVSQQPDGSWTYSTHTPEMRNTYSTATFMALANVVLAAHHLRIDETRGRGTSRKRRVDSVIANATSALHADGMLALWLARRGGGAIDGYQLWSLEKACVFLNIERLDGTPWYAHVARTLVDVQRKDGSWGGRVSFQSTASRRGQQSVSATDALTTTAFALLILVRDMERQRVVTPGGGPKPAPVVTPSTRKPGVAKPARLEPTAVAIDVAAAALARFRKLLKDSAATNEDLLKTLAVLDRARDDIAPPADDDAPEVDPVDLLKGIHAAILDALFLAGENPAGDDEGRAPVNRAAAALLSPASDGDRKTIRRRLERRFDDGRATDGRLAVTPYRPAMRLLATGGGRKTFQWMLDAALHGDATGERAERSLAFLAAVPHFRGLPGSARFAAVKTIANTYTGRASSAEAQFALDPNVDLRSRIRWARFRPAVLDALLFLATDPKTGDEPSEELVGLPLSMKAFTRWLRDHKDKRRPPWR